MNTRTKTQPSAEALAARHALTERRRVLRRKRKSDFLEQAATFPLSIEEAIRTGQFHPALDRFVDKHEHSFIRGCAVSTIEKERDSGEDASTVPSKKRDGKVLYSVRDIWRYLLANTSPSSDGPSAA
jgi:hypothetical protein